MVSTPLSTAAALPGSTEHTPSAPNGSPATGQDVSTVDTSTANPHGDARSMTRNRRVPGTSWQDQRIASKKYDDQEMGRIRSVAARMAADRRAEKAAAAAERAPLSEEDQKALGEARWFERAAWRAQRAGQGKLAQEHQAKALKLRNAVRARR